MRIEEGRKKKVVEKEELEKSPDGKIQAIFLVHACSASCFSSRTHGLLTLATLLYSCLARTSSARAAMRPKPSSSRASNGRRRRG